MRLSPGFIDQERYDAIVAQMPICCVDVIPVHEGSFLLSLRTNDPGKGTWFPIGGRVLKGERILDAAIRKASEELGISLAGSDLRQVITLESIFTGDSIDQNRHSVNVVYAATLAGPIPPFQPDPLQLERVEWFSAIDPNWHPYVQEALRALGFT